MAKVIVKKNMKYKDKDKKLQQELQLVLEPAVLDDIRSNINFVSPNDIDIQNSNTQRRFCLARNEDIYKDYKIKLYTDNGTEKLFAKKGTRPSFSNTITDIINISDTYTFSYNQTDGVTTVTRKNDPDFKLSLQQKLFYMVISGAGGGGRGSLYNVKWYVVWGSQYISLGAPGGSGGIACYLLDMSKVQTMNIYLGKGGTGSFGKDNASDGEDTKITVLNKNITLPGGKAGKESAYANVSSIEWDFSYVYINGNGEGGASFSLNDITGMIFINKFFGIAGRFESTLISHTDVYGTEPSTFRYSCKNQGGSGGSLPSKPSSGNGSKDSITKGSDGANGFFQLFY